MFIIIVVLSVLTRDIKVEFDIDADVLKNAGCVSLRICGLKVYAARFKLNSHGDIVFENKKNKHPELHLNTNKKDNRSVAAIVSSSFLANMRLTSLSLKVHAGVAHDPFLTIMSFGSIRILVYAFLGIIRSRFYVKVDEELVPHFTENRLDFTVSLIINISLGDILYGLVLFLARKFNNLIKRSSHEQHYRTA